MNVEIKGTNLIITLPIEKKDSKSGKSIVVATSGGNQETALQFEGKNVVVGVNAYVKK